MVLWFLAGFLTCLILMGLIKTVCVGMYRPNYLPEDGVAVPHGFSERLGFCVGWIVGRVVRVFRGQR